MTYLDPEAALVVLSGGQDSTTCLFMARQQYRSVHAISFQYGQAHAIELESAATVARLAGVVSHEVLDVGAGLLRSSSPLVDRAAVLERYESPEQMEEVIGDRVELTFVPMRNALFLTLAANRAVASGCGAIVTGVCEADNANYPDCRGAFIRSQEECVNLALGTEAQSDPPGPALRIVTPLLHLDKADSVKAALLVPGCYRALAYSHTAYDGAYPPVDVTRRPADHATTLRHDGFAKAGVPDPLLVRAWLEGLCELPRSENYREVSAQLVQGQSTLDDLVALVDAKED